MKPYTLWLDKDPAVRHLAHLQYADGRLRVTYVSDPPEPPIYLNDAGHIRTFRFVDEVEDCRAGSVYLYVEEEDADGAQS